MSRYRLILAVVLLAFLVLLLYLYQRPQMDWAIEYLPEDTLVYARLKDPAAQLKKISSKTFHSFIPQKYLPSFMMNYYNCIRPYIESPDNEIFLSIIKHPSSDKVTFVAGITIRGEPPPDNSMPTHSMTIKIDRNRTVLLISPYKFGLEYFINRREIPRLRDNSRMKKLIKSNAFKPPIVMYYALENIFKPSGKKRYTHYSRPVIAAEKNELFSEIYKPPAGELEIPGYLPAGTIFYINEKFPSSGTLKKVLDTLLTSSLSMKPYRETVSKMLNSDEIKKIIGLSGGEAGVAMVSRDSSSPELLIVFKINSVKEYLKAAKELLTKKYRNYSVKKINLKHHDIYEIKYVSSRMPAAIRLMLIDRFLFISTGDFFFRQIDENMPFRRLTDYPVYNKTFSDHPEKVHRRIYINIKNAVSLLRKELPLIKKISSTYYGVELADRFLPGALSAYADFESMGMSILYSDTTLYHHSTILPRK